MPTEAFASPLIVWFGPHRYTFPVGRDVTIGRDNRADIRLDGVGTSAAPTHAVLHHNGRQWIAVDRSQAGIYVDGVRMSTVFIHDGRAINLGDPQHGPRLVFQLGVPPPPPPPPPRSAAPPRMQYAPPPPPPVVHRQPGHPGWRPAAQPPPRFDQPNRPPAPPRPVMPTQPAPQSVGPATTQIPPVHPVQPPRPPPPPPPPPPAAAPPPPPPPPRTPPPPPGPAPLAPLGAAAPRSAPT